MIDGNIQLITPVLERVRRDVCCIKQPGKKPFRIDEPLTDAKLAKHLNGGPCYGAYVAQPRASTVRIAVFDFDSHKGESTWEQMQDAAMRVLQQAERVGLRPNPFRSSGGKGVHLIFVWEDDQDAYSVRALMLSVLAETGFKESNTGGIAAGSVEIFPKQDVATAFGHMIVLPLGGKSVPLDVFELDEMPRFAPVNWQMSPPVPKVEKPARAAIPAPVVPVELELLQSALDFIPQGASNEPDRDVYLKIVFGLHHETRGSVVGYEMARAFASRSPTFEADKFERDWNSSRSEREGAMATGQTIVRIAESYGWEGAREAEFSALPADAEAPRELPKFQRDKAGGILATIENVHMALADPDVAGAEIGFDLFRDELMLTPPGEVAWRSFSDPDYVRLRIRFERNGFKPIGREMIRDAVALVGDEHKFDSAMFWLNRLSHDGVARCERFMETYFGVPDSPYARAVSLYLWTALAGRVLEPGIKADMVPVLVGLQGVRKSETLIAMVPHADHYIEVALDERDDTASRKMRGALIGEIAELRGLQSREIEAVKAFITRRHEKWVPKFKEFAVTFPRRLVFVGTSNTDDILTDDTGNRRWLPIRVGAVDTAAVARDRDLLWAEARELFKAGGVQWEAAQTLARAEHESFSVAASDAWLPVIEQWLDTADAFEGGIAPRAREFLTVTEVAQGALQIPVRALKRAEEMRIGKILRILGYDRQVKRVGGKPCRGWFPCG